ncbi:hypothetical protein TIFTF001_053932 [Ficus carica]|uniref:Uncharacterized protein n=1 Tax=Ficus carica TaxID=3494 RepID=A0AA88EH68_FICCA|nr:hypothetical protein TIFTF001_053932 [Ficus carica]
MVAGAGEAGSSGGFIVGGSGGPDLAWGVRRLGRKGLGRGWRKLGSWAGGAHCPAGSA